MGQTRNLGLLLGSRRWASFQESTATALQIHLAVVSGDGGLTVPVLPCTCPNCGTPFEVLTGQDMAAAAVLRQAGEAGQTLTTSSGRPAVTLPLEDGYILVALGCPCSGVKGLPSLRDRAGLAHRLMASFQHALREGAVGHLRSTELATLHQVNQVLLALIQRGNNGLDRVFDLLLSALVILLDAEGSWLEYEDQHGSHRVARGDVEAWARGGAGALANGDSSLRSPREGGTRNGFIVDLSAKAVQGRIGVWAPADMAQARSLMPLFAEECAIAFEIQHLFQLLQSQVAQVLGGMDQAAFLVRPDGTVSYANAAAERLVGKTVLEMAGQSLAGWEAPFAAALQSSNGTAAQSVRMGWSVAGPDARLVDWEVAPIGGGRGEAGGVSAAGGISGGSGAVPALAGWLVTARDMTDYYRWQKAARTAERVATTSMLVSSLAHEVRNPLAAARGLVELMSRNPEPAKTAGYSDLVIREIDRVTRLLNDFLLLGRPAAISPEPFDLAGCIKDLEALLTAEAAARRVELTFENHPVRAVQADSGQVTQVVLNVVRNAFEAAGPNGRVNIKVIDTDGWATLEVRDSGPGIQPAVMKQIFEPFFTTKERGIGLGLAVCRAIVQNHGGWITAANSPEGGAVFTVAFPAQQAVAGEKLLVDVIVVDSDNVRRQPVETALRVDGLRVAGAGDVPSALNLAAKMRPSVVVFGPEPPAGADWSGIPGLFPGMGVVVQAESGSPSAGDLAGAGTAVVAGRGANPGAEGEGRRHPLSALAGGIDYARLVASVRSLLRNAKRPTMTTGGTVGTGNADGADGTTGVEGTGGNDGQGDQAS